MKKWPKCSSDFWQSLQHYLMNFLKSCFQGVISDSLKIIRYIAHSTVIFIAVILHRSVIGILG